MILNSCEYKRINANSPVICVHEADGFLNVRIKDDVASFRLYDLLDITKAPVRTVSFDGVKFDGIHPWVDIPWKNLDKTSGQHVYKVSFMNERQCRYVSTYFSYVIQDNDPYKPYIYISDLKRDVDEEKYGEYLGLY